MNGGATTEANPSSTPPFEGSVLRVEFRVAGLPIPQGSKTMVAPRVFRESSRGLSAWRNAVADKAAETMDGRELLEGALWLVAIFIFPRPQAHYGTGRNANTLKPRAPRWHTGQPDLDKLVRAVGDALTGVVVRNDSMLCYEQVGKMYGSPAGVWIQVWEMP